MFRPFIQLLAILTAVSLTVGFPEETEARGRIGFRSRARGHGGGCRGSRPMHDPGEPTILRFEGSPPSWSPPPSPTAPDRGPTIPPRPSADPLRGSGTPQPRAAKADCGASPEAEAPARRIRIHFTGPGGAGDQDRSKTDEGSTCDRGPADATPPASPSGWRAPGKGAF